MRKLILGITLMLSLTLTTTFNAFSQDVNRLLIKIESKTTYAGEFNYSTLTYNNDLGTNSVNDMAIYIDKNNSRISILYDGNLHKVTNFEIVSGTQYFTTEDDVKFSLNNLVFERYEKVKRGYYKNIEINIISSSKHYHSEEALEEFRKIVSNL